MKASTILVYGCWQLIFRKEVGADVVLFLLGSPAALQTINQTVKGYLAIRPELRTSVDGVD